MVTKFLSVFLIAALPSFSVYAQSVHVQPTDIEGQVTRIVDLPEGMKARLKKTARQCVPSIHCQPEDLVWDQPASLLVLKLRNPELGSAVVVISRNLLSSFGQSPIRVNSGVFFPGSELSILSSIQVVTTLSNLAGVFPDLGERVAFRTYNPSAR